VKEDLVMTYDLKIICLMASIGMAPYLFSLALA
jgi:hypothetical protein